MGNQENEINSDINTKGNINVYVVGNIDQSRENKDNLNIQATDNYNILKQIFGSVDKFPKRYITPETNNKNCLEYEYRIKKLTETKYNAFLFFDKANKKFFDILFSHLYNFDPHNSNRNVVLFFGKKEEIIESFEELYEKSAETAPILIIVNDSTSTYNEQLKYINYVPDLNTIRKMLNKNYKNKLPKQKISNFCKKSLIQYINSKLFRIDMYYNQLGYNLNMINPMDETYLRIKTHITIALLGYSGCGKSTLPNLVFQELVARTSSSAIDVTTKCTEYYLPIHETSEGEIGQIRFLDFPGISEEKNYENIVKPEINKKLEEYNKNMEQIDVALFFITNGNEREFNKAGLDLVNLLHNKKIRIIFVINGPLDELSFKSKKQKLRNIIQNREILYEDLSNLIHTNFRQYFKQTQKTGISQIFRKIIEIIEIKDPNFRIKDINVNNYNQKLQYLSKYNRTFELYDCMTAIKENANKKANLTAAGFSLLSFGSSALSIIVPFVDNVITIGFNVAMVFSIFNIYEIRPRDYDIINIILTEGKSIERKDKINGNINKKAQNERKNIKITNGAKRFANKEVSNGSKILGQYDIKKPVAKESCKLLVKQTVLVAKDTIEVAALKTTTNSTKFMMKKAVEKTMNTSLQKLALKSTKEFAEFEIKESTKKLMVNAAKEAIVGLSTEGGEKLIVAGAEESVKTITESLIIKLGGKTIIINLGKLIPFIGALISGAMNTLQTGKLAFNLIKHFDEEFDENKQRQVDLLISRIQGLFNIIQQMHSIINDENSEITF